MDEGRGFFPPEPLSWSGAELDGVCMGVLPTQRTNKKKKKSFNHSIHLNITQVL